MPATSSSCHDAIYLIQSSSSWPSTSSPPAYLPISMTLTHSPPGFWHIIILPSTSTSSCPLPPAFFHSSCPLPHHSAIGLILVLRFLLLPSTSSSWPLPQLLLESWPLAHSSPAPYLIIVLASASSFCPLLHPPTGHYLNSCWPLPGLIFRHSGRCLSAH